MTSSLCQHLESSRSHNRTSQTNFAVTNVNLHLDSSQFSFILRSIELLLVLTFLFNCFGIEYFVARLMTENNIRFALSMPKNIKINKTMANFSKKLLSGIFIRHTKTNELIKRSNNVKIYSTSVRLQMVEIHVCCLSFNRPEPRTYNEHENINHFIVCNLYICFGVKLENSPSGLH